MLIAERKRWVMYLMRCLKSQWGPYLLNRVINAIYYLCLSKWRNEIREGWGWGGGKRWLFICPNTAIFPNFIYCPSLSFALSHYSSLIFSLCNISTISPPIIPQFITVFVYIIFLWANKPAVSPVVTQQSVSHISLRQSNATRFLPHSFFYIMKYNCDVIFF